MKRKLLFGIVLGTLVIPAASYGFIGAIGAEIIQLIQLVKVSTKAFEQVKTAAAFLGNPSQLKRMFANAAGTAATSLNKPSNGYDLIALQQMAEGRKAALEAMRQIALNSNWIPTAENAEQMSLLHLKAVDATREMNALQAKINYDQQVTLWRATDQGMGNAIEEMNAWHLKQ